MAISYPACLEFLYGLQQHGVKLGLEAITGLLARLGRPDARVPTLHVGGTNGKGSVAAMAAAMLQAAGYRVGLYTSPHLVDFRERIRLNGVPIAEDAVAAMTFRLRAALGDAPPVTFFEFTTALAFEYFAEVGADVAVVEVGMGGRFDATNVITPLASVVTNVALDHQAYLGDTIAAIAFEKAGIIKPRVAAVAGRLHPDALGMIERVAAERGAALVRFGPDFRAEGDPVSGFSYRGLRSTYTDLVCPLPGAHQVENAACALAALELAAERGLSISERAVRSGLAATQWEGRLERAGEGPGLLLDGAHNPAAAAALAEYLSGYRRDHPGAGIILLLGMMRDKDRRGFLDAVLPLADHLVLTQVPLARAASVSELLDAVGDRSIPVHCIPLPAEALATARRVATPDDLICVTGSLMLVGEVKALLRGCGLSPIRG